MTIISTQPQAITHPEVVDTGIWDLVFHPVEGRVVAWTVLLLGFRLGISIIMVILIANVTIIVTLMVTIFSIMVILMMVTFMK